MYCGKEEKMYEGTRFLTFSGHKVVSSVVKVLEQKQKEEGERELYWSF